MKMTIKHSNEILFNCVVAMRPKYYDERIELKEIAILMNFEEIDEYLEDCEQKFIQEIKETLDPCDSCYLKKIKLYCRENGMFTKEPIKIWDFEK